MGSIEELTEEQYTDEKTQRTKSQFTDEKTQRNKSYINHTVDYQLSTIHTVENEELNLKSLRYMRSEIEDIKELLDKKQKQLNNKEQRLKLIEMDLQSREKNIIQTAELKISENLSDKLKKFENDSKIILKRMKSMHDNLRQKTNSFKDLKETYIKNWTKDATSTLKQRNVTLEKMNEIHKQRIKSLENKENESKLENEKLKSKIADMNSHLSILKNQLKT